MAYNESNAPSGGILAAVRGALGLFSGLNKAEGINEDSNPTPIDAYEDAKDDVEKIKLSTQWKRDYATYYSKIESTQLTAFDYWIGKQMIDSTDQIAGIAPLVDNRIFKAMETFIPIATRANPDPLVQADPSEIGQQIQNDVKNALVHEADTQKLRKILKGQLRQWMLNRVGIIKLSYNLLTGKIETVVVPSRRMMFDPKGHWDSSGFFTGEWKAEKKSDTADRLRKLFPKKEEKIREKCQGKWGTTIDYVEWWYKNVDLFYTMEDTVLWKGKNPHWNYDIPPVEGIHGEEPSEENPEGVIGVEANPGQEGINFFDEPHDPYIGLSIFSTGTAPHDDTSLILQNVGLQDMINRRYRQIDDNVRKMNNGLAVSNVFTDSQASQAATVMAKGGAIRVPSGSVKDALMRLPAEPLPADVFKQLEDGRNELDGIFGTSGSTPEGVESQQTVRGKIMINQLDASRIGGGITEYVEEVAATWYQFVTQMMYVHYTQPHMYMAAGSVGGQDLIQIKNTNFALIKSLDITVKDGTLIPRDPLTQRNEAMDLWGDNAIDPLNFYKKLDFADPEQATQDLILWQMFQKGQVPPQAYLPSFQIPGAQPGAAPAPQPGQPGQGQPNPATPQPAPQAPSPQAEQAQAHNLIESVPIH